MTERPSAANILSADEFERVRSACLKLNLTSTIEATSEYGYANPVLCTIEAVWSLSVRYSCTYRALVSYTEWASALGALPWEAGHSPAEAAELLEPLSADEMAEQVFRSRHRTSTTNGILKAEAVRRYLQVLAAEEIATNAEALKRRLELRPKLLEVKGQSHGKSTDYFFMLAGCHDLVKPDRMLQRFVEDVVGRPFTADAAAIIVTEAAFILAEDVPGLTPRALDRAIWDFKRVKGEY
ncbi:MAG: hypothetical protein AB2L09_07210 [Coriobacteriia bacterium]